MVAVGVDGPDQLEPHRFRRADPVGDPEDRPAEQERDDGGQQDADPRLVLSRRIGDRDVDDEKRDGETDSGQRRAACDPAQRQPRRQLPRTPVRCMNHVAPVMPMNFPITRPATMPHVSGDRSAAVTLSASSRTPGVGQREQRQHQERHIGAELRSAAAR